MGDWIIWCLTSLAAWALGRYNGIRFERDKWIRKETALEATREEARRRKGTILRSIRVRR